MSRARLIPDWAHEALLRAFSRDIASLRPERAEEARAIDLAISALTKASDPAEVRELVEAAQAVARSLPSQDPDAQRLRAALAPFEPEKASKSSGAPDPELQLTLSEICVRENLKRSEVMSLCVAQGIPISRGRLSYEKFREALAASRGERPVVAEIKITAADEPRPTVEWEGFRSRSGWGSEGGPR